MVRLPPPHIHTWLALRHTGELSVIITYVRSHMLILAA